MDLSVKSNLFYKLLLIAVVCGNAAIACSGFVINTDSTVFVGKNDDWFDSDSRVWFEPALADEYGRVYFGYGDLYPVGAMNEAGLVMEHFADPYGPIRKSALKSQYPGSNFDQIMAHCATIGEVLTALDKDSLEMFKTGRVLVVDQNADAVIMEGDTVIFKGQFYQICTDSHQSDFPDDKTSDWRYNEIEKLIKNSDQIDVEQCREILAAVQQEITQYSNIYDLKNGKIYLHHFHDFDNYIELDLAEELAKGYQEINIPDLFPNNADFNYTYITRITPQNNLPILVFLIIASIIYLVSVVAWPAGWLIRRQDVHDFGPAVVDPGPGKLATAARLAGYLASLLALIFILASARFPQIYQFGLPRLTIDLGIINTGLILCPSVIAILLVPMSVFCIIIWAKRYWTIVGRIHYLLLSTTLLANVILFWYWDFLHI